MKLSKDVINMATDKKYSQFSSAIKAELHSKLANSEEMKSYVNDIDHIQRLKTAFAEINNGAQS